MAQLQMIFNAETTPIPAAELPEGFRFRTISDAELPVYNELRVAAGFTAWKESDLALFRERVLDDAIYLAEERATGRFAASAAASSSLMAVHLRHGSLDWVMTHPDFRGKHLGRIVSIRAMQRLHEHGYRTFYLLTDDARLPAIKTYLGLGWRPWLFQEDMEPRWRKIADDLGRDLSSLNCLPADSCFPDKVS
ncbi:MAG: GNAT family N-acetyltransferase [Lentisphaeria bacterium]|nr:GNAT family N-acetyltransferase [Lentisphaeria bacterium]